MQVIKGSLNKGFLSFLIFCWAWAIIIENLTRPGQDVSYLDIWFGGIYKDRWGDCIHGEGLYR